LIIYQFKGGEHAMLTILRCVPVPEVRIKLQSVLNGVFQP
jgi:hypothetical protein